jgi:hypothetical protein
MMPAKRFERLMVCGVVLSMGLVMIGCATTGPSKDNAMIIHSNPWKQRKGTAGTPPPDPSIVPGDRRFRSIQGTFIVLPQKNQARDIDDWVNFDGDGNFECGPHFHPHIMALSDGWPKGYLTGFYVVDGEALHLAFCEGSFAEAHCQDIGTGNSISAIVFKGKTYRLKTDSGARPSSVGLEEE